MPNLVNQLIYKELEHEFEAAEGMVLASFGGLTVAETEALRDRLAAEGVRLRMVRNSIAKRVLESRGVTFPEKTFVGNVAIAYGKTEHAILAAKTLTGPEIKKTGKVSLKAGLLEGKVLVAADAHALADIPDRRALQAKLLGVINGPARGLAVSIAALPAAVARVVKARVDAGGGVDSNS